MEFELVLCPVCEVIEMDFLEEDEEGRAIFKCPFCGLKINSEGYAIEE